MNLDKKLIEQAFRNPGLLVKDKYMNALKRTIKKLASGKLQIAHAETPGGLGFCWTLEQWLVDAISLAVIAHKFPNYSLNQFVTKAVLKKQGVRSLVEESVRYGAFIDKKCVIMKSFINIGAHIGEGTMIDTWATIGAGARIGSNVHISGGVGIGGVLEPRQEAPVVISDDCFIGSRSVIVEGVRIGTGSVIASGVFLSGSTRIYDSRNGKAREVGKRIIPPFSVVIPSTYKASSGLYRPCAEIVKSVDPVLLKTKGKTGINQILREFSVSL